MLGDNSLSLATNNLTPQSLETMSRPMQRQALGLIEREVARGLAAAEHEAMREMLTRRAMLDTAALSELMEHLIKIAPSCAPYLETYLAAFGFGAVQTITRW